jgi:hypothetical protein
MIEHRMEGRPHDNCYWVIPGRLMAGEYPIAIREEDGLKKLSAIVRAGEPLAKRRLLG